MDNYGYNYKLKTDIYYKFWTDKEFDPKLYDIALKNKPKINDLVRSFELITDPIIQNILQKEGYKFLERLYDILVYYSDKNIFFDDKCHIKFINSKKNKYNHPLYDIIKYIICWNKVIDFNKYPNKKIDPVSILDMLNDRGYKLSFDLIYKLQMDENLFNKINIVERYDLKNIDSIEHLNIANKYSKIIIPTKFSLETFREFCKTIMKQNIVKKLLKYIKPDITCLENACKNNSFNIIKLIIENGKITPNIKCFKKSCYNERSRDVTLYLFDYFEKDYNKMKTELDNKNKLIEVELVKKIEKK